MSGQNGACSGAQKRIDFHSESSGGESLSVLLYIDNSNMFENAKKHSGTKKGYLGGVADVACRIDIGKLIAKAVGNRGVLVGKLYGSEPPALDTVWNAIRRKKVQVETYERSKLTGKEKEIDTSLTGDAVEDIVVYKDQAGENRTVILFSGDRDLSTVVDKAIKYGYRAEIWSFKSAINNHVKRKADQNPTRLIVNYVDDIFDQVTYTKSIWGSAIPPERSIVLSVDLPKAKMATFQTRVQTLKDVVKTAGEIFRLPMMGRYRNKFEHIVLVPCLKEVYKLQQGGLGSPTQEPTMKKNYQFNKHIKPFFHQLQERLDFCTEIKSWVQFVHEANSQTTSVSVNNQFQLLESDDDEASEVDAEAEDVECNDFFDSHPDDISDAEEDDYVAVVKKETKPVQQYSAPCTHKFWCKNGLKCHYKHSDQEREYFEAQPNGFARTKYKIKPCGYHFADQPFKRCQFESKSYLCSYAHSVEESRCLCCKQKGNGEHWMDECPYKNRF